MFSSSPYFISAIPLCERIMWYRAFYTFENTCNHSLNKRVVASAMPPRSSRRLHPVVSEAPVPVHHTPGATGPLLESNYGAGEQANVECIYEMRILLGRSTAALNLYHSSPASATRRCEACRRPFNSMKT